MKNFRLIKRGINLGAVVNELQHTSCWVHMDKAYLQGGQVGGSRVIRLRGGAEAPGYYGDALDSIDLWAWGELPETRQLLVDVAQEIGGTLGRARVAKMDGRASIVPHIDVGEYFKLHDRYHIVVESPKGTRFTCGDETVIMNENELWWLDNSIIHGVENLADSPRTHLVFDIRPAA